MDFKAFKDEVERILLENGLERQSRDESPRSRDWNRPVKPCPGLQATWETGGTSGGSCWKRGGGSRPYSTDNMPAELSSLDAVLRELCPELTYLAYLDLKRLVYTDTCSDHGYYGNSTDYAYTRIDLEPLHAFLDERNLLPSAPVCVQSP